MRGIVWSGEVEIRDDVELRPPVEREVIVRIVNAGICHSDVSVLNGTIPFPTPVVMGHEGAGIVEEVGHGVTSVAPGDHVVLTTLGNCGQCEACDRGHPTLCRRSSGGGAGQGRFRIGGADAFQFANAGVFSERTAVFETQCVAIDKAVPLASACLIGCALLTGVGAVLNRAQVDVGETVAVIGAGGIGQAVVQAARLASAGRVVVIDSNPAKEAAARQMGATDFVDASSTDDIVSAVRAAGLPEGVDYVFECVGHPDLIKRGTEMLGWGGSCVILGVPTIGSEASFVVSDLYHDKSIMGCRYGSARPHHDIPMIVDLYQSGRLLLDEMVSAVYGLSRFEEAVGDMEHRTLNRAVLEISA